MASLYVALYVLKGFHMHLFGEHLLGDKYLLLILLESRERIIYKTRNYSCFSCDKVFPVPTVEFPKKMEIL